MIKKILILLLVFVLAVIIAFYNEDSYRVLVRFFFKLYQGDKIRFFGKNFHLLASPYFVIAFGLFSVFLTRLLYKQNTRQGLIYFIAALGLFFVTTMATTYIDSFIKVAYCTACKDGVKKVHYNDVRYDFHFITSLLVGLLPLYWKLLKNGILKR